MNDLQKADTRKRLPEILRYYGAKEPRTGKGNWDCIPKRHNNPKDDLSIDGDTCCCHCDLKGDSFDIIAIMESLDVKRDFPEITKKAAAILNIDITEWETNKKPGSEKWNHSLIEKWHKNVNKTEYFKGRGLSDKTINKYKLGYSSNGSERYGANYKYSLPVTDNFVIVRAIEGIKPKTMNPEGIGAEILNLKYLTGEDNCIFITEGYFDALSIEELDYKCIGLNSASMADRLIETINKNLDSVKKKTFILCPDNDKAGNELKSKMQDEFKKLGLVLKVFTISGQYKDINEYIIKDREELTKELRIIVGGFVSSYLETFLQDIKENKNKPIISTGFLQLNKKMGGGMFPGLYVVGGISSLGKTAFTLQLADNIAQRGNDVIFFSLEMSKLELISRSISRNLFEVNHTKCRDYGTLKIMRGDFSDVVFEMDEALMQYKKTADNLIIKEGNFDTGVDEIRTEIQNHIENTGKKPIVFIDYLQVLKSRGNGNDKQEMDYNVTELKRISRDFDIPVIAVSSFNRGSYLTPVSFECFKESGSIEYTADVLIGLQMSVLSELNLSSDRSKWEARTQVNTAIKEVPRKITAVILKQRNAQPRAEQKFLFYPVNNLFKEEGAC